MSSDIRKWFIKQHDKGKEVSGKHAASQKSPPNVSGSVVKDDTGHSQRRKTSKYFPISSDAERNYQSIVKDEIVVEKVLPKRKSVTDNGNMKDDVKPSPAKKFRMVDVDDDDEFAPSSKKKISVDTKSGKKSNDVSGVRHKKKSVDADGSDEDDHNVKGFGTPPKDGGRGRGRRGQASAAGGKGGRGGFINFGERKDPPHKGEKEVPEGAPDCLAGLTFVISGTLDSLEREEAEDLIKCHGGRVTGSVSKKTSYLLADEDVGGRKSSKAKELGTVFLTEDGLFDMIRKSKPAKTSNQEGAKNKTPERKDKSLQKDSHVMFDLKGNDAGSGLKNSATKNIQSNISSRKKKISTVDSLTWTEKYQPKVPNDIVGNQSNVKQLQDWFANWHKEFVHDGKKVKGKKQNESATKRAVLISGSPGIGKSTSAMLVSQMLGFHVIEVNASDSRGKADSKIVKGVGGSTSNSIKELIGNEALSTSKDWSKYPKSVLIMDEVDGMSAGDRGGVADLIASIKVSKIPIICICNDRYSQKLKSLVNYCLPLNFRKPTKQQMAKRLFQICQAEGLQVNEIALEELAERVNGDMRLALNQLQYMALSQSVIKYDDIRERFLSSAKDEDISPFAAVDKLFDVKGGKLRMDARIDLSMSDPDLVPLIIQENYINYRPSSVGKDDNGVKRMHILAQAAESIADGDIVNVQIRRYRQWQLSQASSFTSSIIPAALMHGNRETFEPGERNYNRFGGWLGKNSTTGKNSRLLENVHIHVLASQASLVDRQTLRVDYFSLFIKKLCDPLHTLPKDAAVQMVIEFMNTYSLSQEDFETILELSKFQGHPKPMDGVQPAVKAALTKAYKQDSSRVVRTADLISLPGIKKAPKKRIAALIDPLMNGSTEENDALLENEEGSDLEEDGEVIDQGGDAMPQLDLQTDSRKGIQVMLDLKSEDGKSIGRKTPASKPSGSGSASKGGRGGAVGGKRKR